MSEENVWVPLQNTAPWGQCLVRNQLLQTPEELFSSSSLRVSVHLQG